LSQWLLDDQVIKNFVQQLDKKEPEEEGVDKVWKNLKCYLKMPKIYEKAGLVFFFYPSDMDEPPHVHVEYKEDRTMKVWLKEEELETTRIRAGMPRHKQTETY